MNIIGGILEDMSKFFNSFEDKREYQKILIENSQKCKELTYKYKESVQNGCPIMSEVDYKKELLKIVSNPNEEKSALNKLKLAQEYNEAQRQKLRSQRKIGYKYEEDIFKMFDVKHELDHKDIFDYIKNVLNTKPTSGMSIAEHVASSNRADEIFNIWTENCLIERCYKQPSMFRVGVILTSETFSLDKDDLTRDKWLKQNGKSML